MPNSEEALKYTVANFSSILRLPQALVFEPGYQATGLNVEDWAVPASNLCVLVGQMAIRKVLADLGVPQKAIPKQHSGPTELLLRREIIRGEKQGSVRSRYHSLMQRKDMTMSSRA